MNMKSIRFTLATLAFALSGFVSTPAHADLDIVATTPDLAAVAKAVGGKYATVKAMSSPNQDPHYVDPKPSLTLMLNKADMLVINGLDLEVGWLPPIQTNARNPKVQTGGSGFFDASQFVKRQGVTDADRAKGDIHPGGNPHYMHDPRSAARVARALGDQMARIDTDHASDYKANTEKFIAQLESAAKKETQRFKKLDAKKRQVVSYHESLVYLFDWLALEQVITVEPRPGIAPNPGHVAKVLKTMRSKHARVIVQEAYYPTKTSKTLARMAKGEVAVIPGGTNFQGGETYIERVERTAGEIYDAIK